MDRLTARKVIKARQVHSARTHLLPCSEGLLPQAARRYLTLDRRNPETLAKLNAYDLGHSRLYDPIFAMKDAHVADETGCVCGNDPYFVQFDKVNEKGYPWNFEIPGKGSFKIDDEMYRNLKAGYDKLMEHGHLPWLSCNPYLNTRIPIMGQYAASSESSAACYINTVLGARTNRESAVNTVYCAYTGCLPKYGTHLDEYRAAKCIVELDDEVHHNIKGMADWGALGAVIAAKAQNRIMAVLNLPKKMGPGATKNLISCASPGMNDPILHLMGITPESPTLEAAFKGKMPKNPERFKVTMDDIVEMYHYLNNPKLCAGFGSEGTTWIYAKPEALVNAAVTGVFTPTARWEYWSQPKEMRLASEKDRPLYDGHLPMIS
jgi:hypothetical protein